MRRRVLAFLVAVPLALALAAAAWPRAPKAVTITGACTPSGNADVRPRRRDMTRLDHVEWREPTRRAASWMITPKDPADWPFADTIRGNQTTPAATALPPSTAAAGHPFAYEVTITCQDGRTQVIDPEIVIGN